MPSLSDLPAGDYLDEAGGNLLRSVIVGAVLLLLGLAAFLFSWRKVLISAVAIALSLMAAALVLGTGGSPHSTPS